MLDPAVNMQTCRRSARSECILVCVHLLLNQPDQLAKCEQELPSASKRAVANDPGKVATLGGHKIRH